MREPRFGPPPAEVFEVTPSPDEIAFYVENGYLVVDRLTSDAEIDWLTKIFDAVFAEAHPATFEPGREPDQAGPPLIQQSMFPEMRFPELLTTSYHRNAKRYAAALMGLPAESLSTWGHMILKPPQKSREAPWHQDEAYWEPELDYDAIAAWLPLHDVSPERGCMQFIPKSQKGDVLTHEFMGDPLGNLLVAPGADASKAVACPLRKGGATFHHPRTIHYTAPNTTDEPRRAFPMEFQRAPVRRAVPADNRPWVYERRRITSSPEPAVYIADGRVVPAPT